MEDKVIEKMEESIGKILEEGLNTNNLDHLYKLSKIKHLAKEDKDMYGEYNEGYGARGRGRGSYGEYNAGYGEYNEGYNEGYGARRGRRRRYRGDDHLERMEDDYGRYEERRRNYRESGNYGAKEDSTKSLRYMLEATVDFFKMLNEEAEGQEEKQLIRQYIQKISQMQ